MIRTARWAVALGLFGAAFGAAAETGEAAGEQVAGVGPMEAAAPPAGSVFAAVLLDASLADAPARGLGRHERADPSTPPYGSAIGYDPAEIDGRRSYAVRGELRADNRAVETPDTVHPVLTRGAGTTVDLELVSVPAEEGSVGGRVGGGTVLGWLEGLVVTPARAQTGDGEGILRGLVRFTADGASFLDCESGQRYIVAREGDLEALEHAYLASGAEPGGALMASFEGNLPEEAEGEAAAERVVVVDRFVGVWPEETCEMAMGPNDLLGRGLRILQIGEIEMGEAVGRSMPLLLLDVSEEGEPRFSATVGCNQMIGSYTLEEERLSFGAAASTRMACQSPLDAWEQALAGLLADTALWRSANGRVELLDDTGQILAALAPEPDD